MPVYFESRLSRFEDGVITVSLADPTPIGSWNLQTTCLNRFGGSNPLFLKSSASGYNGVSGITIVNSGQGVFNFAVNSADTSGLAYGAYATVIERLDSGHRTELDAGYLLVTP